MSAALSTRLIAHLLEKRNARGLTLGAEQALRKELSCSWEELQSALEALVDEGWIDVLAPLPFLAVKIKMWPGKRQNAPGSMPIPYSYSSTLLQSRLNRNSYRGATDSLLQEILETTGETDPATFKGALETYSPPVIRLALERVRSARAIRKNKTALFRHLLPRLARESSR